MRRLVQPKNDVGRQRRQLLRVHSRSRREYKRGRQYEPRGEADPNRHSTAEEAAAAWPVQPTAVHRSDGTRASRRLRPHPASDPPLGPRVIRALGLRGNASSQCCDNVLDRSATANQRQAPPISDGDAAQCRQTC